MSAVTGLIYAAPAAADRALVRLSWATTPSRRCRIETRCDALPPEGEETLCCTPMTSPSV